ncbi:MAG: hypothetical protein V1899_00250 [Planctomycetota bacterium]
MKEKVVLIGAGSAMFTRGLVFDLIRRNWEIDLALVDISPEALDVAAGLTRKMIAAKRPAIILHASTDRREVLKDATVVICTIGVGGRRAWEQDVYIPRKYGVYQPVGDSVMPGGTSRALRMLPAMVEIAKDVLDLAPGALFFNYGNPMSCICRGVRKATGANLIGLCHGVNHVGKYLAQALDVSAEVFQYTAVGLNHLTWFTEARVRGHDAMPRLRQFARQRLAKQIEAVPPGTETGTALRDASVPSGDNPLCWSLFDLFGAFPAVLDRHVSEFFPQFCCGGKYYGKTLGVDCFNFERVIAQGDKRFAEMRTAALSEQPLAAEYFASIGGEHEQVVDIIESIRRNDRCIYSANLPNTGLVPNLPTETIVEVPAVADGGTLKGIAQPPLPSALAGTLATRIAWVETAVEAALEGSRDKFVQALVIDGWVNSIETASKLADELLAAQAAFLPQFDSRQPDLSH